MPSSEPLSGRCGARTRDGGYCTQWPVGGRQYGKRCRMHGGRLPRALEGTRRRAERAKVEQAVAQFGLAREVDPHMALVEEVCALAGNVACLRALVDEHTLVQRVVTDSGVYERPSAWAALYLQAHDRLVRVCRAAIAAGVEEQRVRLAQRQAALIVEVLRRSLADLGLTDDLVHGQRGRRPPRGRRPAVGSPGARGARGRGQRHGARQ